jgi:regulator of replication initiation timing
MENAGGESMVTKARKARKVRNARTAEDIDPAVLELSRQSFMSLYKVTKQLQRENKKLRVENARFRSRIAKLTAR